jgi:hypothetical protein
MKYPQIRRVLIRGQRFVHERGFRTAVFNLGILGGINLAVPIGELSRYSFPVSLSDWRQLPQLLNTAPIA